jgi:tetratricopeptide (TPR) repeat protein
MKIVEKERFLSLVKNYTSLNPEEASSLITLQEQFPYSQLLHNLAARAARDNNLAVQDDLLHVSAIYTTDRAVLKSIMTTVKSERIAESNGLPKPDVKMNPGLAKIAELKKHSAQGGKIEGKTDGKVVGLTGDALRKDIVKELGKLKVSKHNFEVAFDEYEKMRLSLKKKEEKKDKRLHESAEPADAADTLIKEIKTTKKKVNPEGKQKEQIEIIENFIKTKPSIAKNKSVMPADTTDLAEKNLHYGDNIVSETLVEILLKQGKKDKAIEVLKKLIWKFPQKKAYFAAQIEELKKN